MFASVNSQLIGAPRPEPVWCDLICCGRARMQSRTHPCMPCCKTPYHRSECLRISSSVCRTVHMFHLRYRDPRHHLTVCLYPRSGAWFHQHVHSPIRTPTMRKPMLPRLFRSSRLRCADRNTSAVLFQPPPRMTRVELSPPSHTPPSVGAPP